MRESFVLTVLLGALAMSVPAAAQISAPKTRPERPTSALFGGGAGKTEQQLMLNISFGAGYDDDLLGESIGTSLGGPNVTPRSGGFTVGTVGLAYKLQRSRVDASLSATSSGRYYPGVTDSTIGTYGVGGHVSVQISSRTALTTSHQFGLLPNVQRILFGIPIDGSTAGDLNDPSSSAIGRATYRSLYSTADLSQQLTKRLSVSAGYFFYKNDSLIVGQQAYEARTVRAGVSYEIARGLAARLGYSIVEARHSTLQAGQYSGRSLDGGIDFNRAISLTRRTQLTFATGATGLQGQGGRTQYFATGHASLSREIGRSWTTNLTYRRGVDFFQAFAQPLISDTLAAGLSGNVGNRLSISSSAGYGAGSVGLSDPRSSYSTSSANLALQIGLTRLLALGIQYGYYHYLFAADAAVPDGFEGQMNRQSIRFSLDLRVPLLMRARRSNATR